MSAFSHQTLSEQKAKWRPEFPFQQGVSCHGEIEAFPRLQEQSGSDWFPQAWRSGLELLSLQSLALGFQRRQAGLCLLGLNSCLPGRNRRPPSTSASCLPPVGAEGRMWKWRSTPAPLLGASALATGAGLLHRQ